MRLSSHFNGLVGYPLGFDKLQVNPVAISVEAVDGLAIVAFGPEHDHLGTKVLKGATLSRSSAG